MLRERLLDEGPEARHAAGPPAPPDRPPRRMWSLSGLGVGSRLQATFWTAPFLLHACLYLLFVLIAVSWFYVIRVNPPLYQFHLQETVLTNIIPPGGSIQTNATVYFTSHLACYSFAWNTTGTAAIYPADNSWSLDCTTPSQWMWPDLVFRRFFDNDVQLLSAADSAVAAFVLTCAGIGEGPYLAWIWYRLAAQSNRLRVIVLGLGIFHVCVLGSALSTFIAYALFSASFAALRMHSSYPSFTQETFEVRQGYQGGWQVVLLAYICSAAVVFLQVCLLVLYCWKRRRVVQQARRDELVLPPPGLQVEAQPGQTVP